MSGPDSNVVTLSAAGQRIPTRGGRRRPSATAIAYALASTVLRDESLASEIAITAIKKGGVARVGILAHARHSSLAALGLTTPVDPHTTIAASHARELAWQLAGVRPGAERAIVDLDVRYGLDSASFARALGLTTTRAGVLAREVEEMWATHLDPALLASLGAAGCEVFEQILLEAGIPAGHALADPPTGEISMHGGTTSSTHEIEGDGVLLTVLLAAAPAVLQHASGCEQCAGRLRSMTSVRMLNGHRPIPDVPASVGAIAAHARRRIGAPPPPSFERHPLDRVRLLWLGVAVIVVITVGSAVLGTYQAFESHRDTSDRIARLVDSPTATDLQVSPDELGPARTTFTVRNGGTRAMLWNAVPTASWLRADPTNGRLEPGHSVTVTVNADSLQKSDAAITVTSGSSEQQVIRYVID